MKILADENLHREIVAFLRSQGHDVTYVAEFSPSEKDPAILELAWMEKRILITSDLDFGELVIRQQKPSCGILLLRFRFADGNKHVLAFKTIWRQVESRIADHLVVVANHKIKARRLGPGAEFSK